MRARSAALATVFVLSLGACATTSQPQHRARIVASNCANLEGPADVAGIYAAGKVARVEPIYRQMFVARAFQPQYVAGAEIYVPAEPWMNQAYMERALTCHAAGAGVAQASDLLRTEGVVDVDVVAAGPYMRISVLGKDRRSGKAIFQRATALQDEVAVEQMPTAAAPNSSPAL